MKRFTLYSRLKPEKVEEYVHLHTHPWPEILQVLEECHFHHYSISIKGNELFTYYEYTGDDLEADERRMGESPDMQRWWTHTKPCFLHHDEGHYYDDLTEIFYKN